MARQDPLHWTVDRRFSYLRITPTWYHHQSCFYTKAPSAKMEMKAAAERRRQWQWHGSPGARDSSRSSCVEASCMPCAVYSRAWTRLRAALAGRDAHNIPTKGSCSFDFYGCFIARLQTTVRSFYGIDGRDVNDCSGEPAGENRSQDQTILRNANEATPQKPMPMSAAIVGEHELTKDQLVARGFQGIKHGLETDPMTQQTGKFVEHVLAQDPVEATPVVEASHPLDEDTEETEGPGVSKHDLARDQVAQTGSSGPPHALKDDDSLVLALPDLKHTLQTDPTVQTPDHETSHTLKSDSARVSVGTLALAHGLHDDARVCSVRQASGHGIEEDMTVATGDVHKPHRLGE
ncbi:Major facilitator superfamily domain, general substrate transporter [Purpureocillium lavendulum]|uniref:Major facilitator superfamily domain, general substrate transporter n=1 Tax=Purpureocillium lavendulum TaxID=1247861 RepID=A0AB34FM13_9HYPO|nr:Major facilitator superfamily domain, general substrate transporter [Purpureocillium lavendulum]